MRILSRYLLQRFLTWFAVLFMVLSAVIALAELLLNLDELTAVRGGFSGALQVLGLKLVAYYLPVMFPVTAFVAMFLCLGFAARGLEVTAMKAGGISPLRAAVPLLVAAMALTALALVLDETAVLGAERAWRQQTPESETRIDFRRGSFWYHSARYIYNVKDADPETRTLSGVRIFELTDEGRLVRRIDARQARIDEEAWFLDDVIERRFDLAAPERPPEIVEQAEMTLHDGEHRDAALLGADAETLSLVNLRELIGARRRTGEDTTRFEAQFHTRLSSPLTVLLLSLLAVPLALRVERHKTVAFPALLGVLWLAAFFGARNAVSILADQSARAASTLPWALVAVFLVAGAWSLLRVPR